VLIASLSETQAIPRRCSGDAKAIKWEKVKHWVLFST
jgi:hypothetical protein